MAQFVTESTIFALSSGMPPAAIAVIRVSGPATGAALLALAGSLPVARRATLATLRHPVSGDILDRALVLWFPGPATATGDDLAEIHAHGGRAVVRGIEEALAAVDGLRPAAPGEFTRRALLNGRIDLAEAEGLADLLSAETAGQRRQALGLAHGTLSRVVDDWQSRLLTLSAEAEAIIDFDDEDDVTSQHSGLDCLADRMAQLSDEWRGWRARPRAEPLRDGLRVAIMGPPNSGKSTLINALTDQDRAIVSPIAGTTRDVIDVHVAIAGIAFRLADTAGLRADAVDPVEIEGMKRGLAWADSADMLLWLGPADEAPQHSRLCRVAAQADRRSTDARWSQIQADSDVVVSAVTGQGMADLIDWLVASARSILPVEGEVALNARHAAALGDAIAALDGSDRDIVLVAECLRQARVAIDRITGQAGTEAMLDTLFARFCIGK